MSACVTTFIDNMISNLIDLFIAALVLWFLVIATQVIQAQHESDSKDDVEQEWAAIRYFIGQHIKYASQKIRQTRTFSRLKKESTQS